MESEMHGRPGILRCLSCAIAFGVLALAPLHSGAASPSNPEASAGARAVLAYLASLPAQAGDNLIVGQHVGYTTSYYYAFTDYVPLGYQTYVASLQKQSGKWLGLIGVDFSTIDPNYTYPLDYRDVTPTLIDHWNRGGLVTVMYSARNPWTWNLAHDRSVMGPMAEIVTPGTAANRNWITQLDSVAAGLQVLRDAGVVVLFRPLHEMNGGWFWWGSNPANPTNREDTIALWRYTHDYLSRGKGLDNLLWVYAATVQGAAGITADELAFYPGDNYVDVVGLDRYAPALDTATVAAFGKLRALGKPMCLCEMGPTTAASDGTFDYQAFVAGEIRTQLPDIVYAMAWSDYPARLGGTARNALVSNRNAAALVLDPGVATAEDLPRFAGLPGIAVSLPYLDFGGQSLNTTAPVQAVTLTNAGAGAVRITSIATAAPFAVRHDCSASLAAGTSCTAGVTFTPTRTGGASGALTITADVPAPVVALSGVGEKSLVTHYYQSILRRAPDAGGKAYWEGVAATLPTWGAGIDETWYAMAMSFYASAEYRSFNRDDAGFVTDLYRTFFNRDPDAGGLDYWVDAIARGVPREVVLASFMFSTEFAGFTQAIFDRADVRAEVDVVMDFYRGLLGRLPDRGGFDNWLAQVRAAQCRGPGAAAAVSAVVDSISRQFLASGEYAGRGRSNGQFVGDLYNAFLRRGGDAAGVRHWITQLDLGNASRDQERIGFLASPEFSGRVAAIAAEPCLLP